VLGDINMMKRLMAATVGTVLTASLLVGSAFADNIGYVNFEKLMSEYDQAQGFLADTKVREAELRKLQADYVKQIEEARKQNPKNPVAANQLEKNLNDQLTVKVREYRDWSTTQQKAIDNTLQAAVKQSAAQKQVDVVLSSQAIFDGGTDLTSDVLARLNTAQ
jgi:Skp family chaperone for outer membrane proteins